MKRAPAAAATQVQTPVLPLRIWRVFEYRRPLPRQRPRFTT
jgi:hypothetical protein